MAKTDEEIQREKSKKEALQFDRQQRIKSGEVIPSSGAEKKIMNENIKKREEAEERNKNQLLEKFTEFLEDPLGYLHSQVSMGEWANRNERYQLYSLLTQIRLQQSLEELVSLLSKKK